MIVKRDNILDSKMAKAFPSKERGGGVLLVICNSDKVFFLDSRH